MLKNKLYLSIAAIVVAIIVLGGGVYWYVSKKAPAPVVEDVNSGIIPTLTPQQVGLKVYFGDDRTCAVKQVNNVVNFSLSNTQDMKHVTWVFTYEADVPAVDRVEGGNNRIQQEFGSEADIAAGTTFDSKQSEKDNFHVGLLGTCSKNDCRCDTGVQSVNLVLKILKADGKEYQVTQAATLPQ